MQGMDDYAASKARIFQGQGVHGPQSRRCAQSGGRSPGREVVTFGLNPPPRAV
jgi:UDP-N-acetylmuramoylalanine-D-glutamate ligase